MSARERRIGLAFGAALGLFALAASAAAAPEAPASRTAGVAVFKTYCASCHGSEARGNGPLADKLRTAPPDLTLLARRNKGTFDAEMVGRIIDGRKPVKFHGGPDMPVWGDAFKESHEGYSEERVKARIESLVDYLRSVQQPKDPDSHQ
jgi:mono/diheme cytochrome c family protein